MYWHSRQVKTCTRRRCMPYHHRLCTMCDAPTGTLSNMKVLMTANVETVIVLRSCAPLCVSITDYCFHQRALPSRRSSLAMLAILGGASMYVYVEQKQSERKRHEESREAYAWLALWFTLLIFQLTYGKQLVTGLGLQSIWSPVLYTNALALPPTAMLGYMSGDLDRCVRIRSIARHTQSRLLHSFNDRLPGCTYRLRTVEWTVAGMCWLLLSCVAGVGISWAGFKCQQVITATAYTVVGVMNKLLTVLINVRCGVLNSCMSSTWVTYMFVRPLY